MKRRAKGILVLILAIMLSFTCMPVFPVTPVYAASENTINAVWNGYTLEWDKISGVSCYSIWVDNTRTEEDMYVNTSDTRHQVDFSEIIDQMIASGTLTRSDDNHYDIRVYALNEIGVEVGRFDDNLEYDAPQPGEGIENIKLDGAVLSWDNLNGPYYRYALMIDDISVGDYEYSGQTHYELNLAEIIDIWMANGWIARSDNDMYDIKLKATSEDYSKDTTWTDHLYYRPQNQPSSAENGKVSIDNTEAELKSGDRLQLYATYESAETAGVVEFDWASSDESIVLVSKDGIVTACSPGNAVVSASYGGSVAECTITVVRPETIIADGTCGEHLSWDLSESGELRVYGEGVISESPWKKHSEKINKVSILDGVTGISAFAFSDLVGLTELVMPDSLTSIADDAFYGCVNLEHYSIPSSVSDIGIWAFPVDISEADITSIRSSFKYDWLERPCRPEYRLTYRGYELSNEDYSLSYNLEHNAGVYPVVIEGRGRFKSKTSTSYAITALDFFKDGIEFPTIPNQVYNGSYIKPTITPEYGMYELVEGKDFTATYEYRAGTYPGLVIVDIKGKGNFTGTKRLSFEVVRKSISACTFETIPSMTYTGKELKPAITVNDHGYRVGYHVNYFNNINVGTAHADVYGENPYTGLKVLTFRIDPLDIGNVSFDYTRKVEYTGEAITPTVKPSGTYYSLGSNNYTVSYSNNVDAGKATITITGRNNCKGSCTRSFTIEPAALNEAVVSEIPNQTYNGDEIKPEVILTYSGKKLKEGEDYTVNYKNNVEPGFSQVVITGKGNYTGTITKTFEIEFYGGWRKLWGNWHYYDDENTMRTNNWAQDDTGWRWLDGNGNVATSKWISQNGEWYYLNFDGYRAENQWAKDSKGWCYLASDGHMVTNDWVKDSKGWCWIASNGYMPTTTQWIKYNGGWYYIEKGYRVENSWRKDSKGWCYLGPDGRMVTNDWVKDSKGYCWIGSNGYMPTTTQWIQYNGDWYHITDGYRDQSKWMKDSKGWCWLQADGRMLTNGWAKDSIGWCWIASNGYMPMTTQWVKYDGVWYHITKGYRDQNKWMKDSKGWCWLQTDGRMLTSGWAKDSIGWCWIAENGYMPVETGWIGEEGVAGSSYIINGYRVDNKTIEIKGVSYTFDANGKLVE